ncbi:hypothetical protein BX600DRAFT_473117 [Xylariales sp. PMI_506]|nr:hypothetical protein BX600DRAFT_473117 [Xylariales sp. PMI_506]
MAMHHNEAVAMCGPTCIACGGPTAHVVQTPRPYLHLPEDPFVLVTVDPVCSRKVCETHARQIAQKRMLAISSLAQAEDDGPPSRYRSNTSVEVVPCLVCGETQGTKKCSRCGGRGCCGTKHQKEDWPRHKLKCVAPST